MKYQNSKVHVPEKPYDFMPRSANPTWFKVKDQLFALLAGLGLAAFIMLIIFAALIIAGY